MKTKWREIIIVVIALLLISLVITSFSAWDNDLPADNQTWNTAAASIRDNWDALEVVLGVDLAAGIRTVINVTNPAFGAVGDGVTDDAPAIQAAFDYALTAFTQGAGTGWKTRPTVFFPPGVYLCKSTLIFYKYINYEGVRATVNHMSTDLLYDLPRESAGSIIRAHPDIYANDNNSYGVLAYIEVGDLRIAKLHFVGTTAWSTIDPSVAIQFGSSAGASRTHETAESNCSGISISECTFAYFTRAWEANRLNDAFCYNARFENNGTDVYFGGQTAATSQVVEFIGSVFYNHYNYGFDFKDDPDNSIIIRVIGGIFTSSTSGKKHIRYICSDGPDVDLTCIGTYFRHSSNTDTYHVYITGTFDNPILRWKFIGCRFEAAKFHFERTGGTKGCEGWEFRSCDFYGDGSLIANRAHRGKITNCTFNDYVIAFDTTARSQIHDNFFRNISGTAVTYTGADCDNNSLEGNYFNDDVSTPVSVGAGSTIKIAHNFGFITENSGVATLINGQTTKVVSHGCAVTPAAGDVVVCPVETWGNMTKFYVDTITSTQFTIRADQNPGQDVDFAWQVRANHE